MKTTIAFLIASLISLGVAVANAADAPKGEPTAVATCADGKTMYSASGEHRGACRGHGGVAKWADGSPVKSKGGKRSYK